MPPSELDTIKLHLSACLALTRPVSMTDQAAMEWVRIGANALKHFRAEHVEAGCKRAQRECSHHGKIIPTVTIECEKLNAEAVQHARHRAIFDGKGKVEVLSAPRPSYAEILANERWLNCPAGEEARKLGLSVGALIEQPDGSVRYIPELR